MLDRARDRRPMHSASKRGRLRPFASFILLLLVAQALAGCADSSDAEAVTPPDSADGGNGPGGAGNDSGGNGSGSGSGGGSGGDGTFLIEDLLIVDQDDNETLHEDDEGRVTFTIRHPGTPDERVTRFVSLAVDGDVVQLNQISLEPGESKAVEHALGTLRGRGSIVVEVRVGPTSERTEASVENWPRTDEKVQLGPLSLEVRRWLQDEDRSTVVNLSLSRADDPDAPSLSKFEAKLLCTDASGNVTAKGEARPSLPAAGQSGTQNVRLPQCEDMLYGVSFTASLDGEPVERRVLYVERGWQPPEQGT